tara:strand:- start:10808 stop:12121 length:1314 start_codon:yes stop_codon:yes gene_type:complete
MEQLQDNPQEFEEIQLSPNGTPTDFAVQLGESVLTLRDGSTIDGFRFTAPENADSMEFVWYFNAPNSWANWYLCPAKGEFKPSFRSWLPADKLYEKFDESYGDDRFRTLQTLESGYFVPGEEYILWFRQMEKDNGTVSGRILLTESEEEWDYATIEEILELHPLPVEAQAEVLGGKGAEILLNPEWFTRAYAENRINDSFENIRSTQRFRDGFFITMETAIPPCKTTPSFTAIRETYGTPDFIQSSEERKLLFGDSESDEEPNVITYIYDYFGFEVDPEDPEAKVLRVVTYGYDLSVLNPESDEPTFRRLSIKNLTVFYNEGQEVGRLYFFLEGQKDPIVIQEPPVGRYERGDQVLEFLGEGKWTETTYFEDGSVAKEALLEANQLNGETTVYYPDGTPRFVIDYKDGAIDGKVVEYSWSGKKIKESVYKNNKRVAE